MTTLVSTPSFFFYTKQNTKNNKNNEYNIHIHIYTYLAKEPIRKTTEEHIPQSPEVPHLIMEDT